MEIFQWLVSDVILVSLDKIPPLAFSTRNPVFLMAKSFERTAKATQIIQAARRLRTKVSRLDFSPAIQWVYNPLDYAWEAHRQYISKHFQPSCRVLLLGMNPGPWGMSQTGIPFGEVNMVKDWLGINAPIGQPEVSHPNRPILGLNCSRSEVSGHRFWGFFKQQFGATEKFFADHFVASYCPLAFMSESGANVTPDKLPSRLRLELQTVCDEHLSRLIEIIQPNWVVGVGNWAEERCRGVLEQFDNAPQLGKILHPSPASPAANLDWPETVRQQLINQGVWRKSKD